MSKNTVDIYIAGNHFKINHENGDYVRLAASIVEQKLQDAKGSDKNAELSKSLILACLDLCDDMLTAKSKAETLTAEINKLNAQIAELKHEIDYFKSPKFIIPDPIGKNEIEISPAQLCFPPFENISKLIPAVNELNVSKIRKSVKVNE